MYYYGCWPHYHFTQNIVGSIAQKKKKKKKMGATLIKTKTCGEVLAK